MAGHGPGIRGHAAGTTSYCGVMVLRIELTEGVRCQLFVWRQHALVEDSYAGVVQKQVFWRYKDERNQPAYEWGILFF